MNIELHIEELVLHGFAPGDRDRIASAVQQELTVLLTEQGVSLPAQSATIAKLTGKPFALPTTPNANLTGTQIAHSVFDAMQARSSPS